MTGWRLLLTRPAAESAALAETLAAAGVFSRSLPLLATEALEETPEQRAMLLNLTSYSAVIVVSKPAARHALQRLALAEVTPPAGQLWFTVGGATAQLLAPYLQALGLDVAYPPAGDDSEALLALPQLAGVLAQPAPRVLIMRGEGGRELLAETLRAHGAVVDYLELYRRVMPAHAPGALTQLIQAERLNAVLVSSGQGLANLRELAGAAWPQLSRLPLLVPSVRVAEQARLAGAQQIIDCRGANAAAVLAALHSHAAPSL
ncbi:uroporphyrinogen-III synthase [Pseudomonas sp. zbq_18]|uniref:uroporphyrinogen-III synthase n=1 Tax=Pseudomonadota TaxID=1224 RepID=UPI00370BA2BC